MLDDITRQVSGAVKLLLTKGNLEQEQIFVLGASTSEVAGYKIGTAGSIEIAAAIWQGVREALDGTGLYLAVQCCEHLNRALVVDRECSKKYSLEEVTVIPVAKAGGAMAEYAYRHFKEPVLVESIRAHYGLDIGQTLIGMHLKPVAVPVRNTYSKIGNAILTMAYSRPKLIGGERAVYC